MSLRNQAGPAIVHMLRAWTFLPESALIFFFDGPGRREAAGGHCIGRRESVGTTVTAVGLGTYNGIVAGPGAVHGMINNRVMG
jgi:hypothetical protein